MSDQYKNYYDVDYTPDASRSVVWKEIVRFLSKYIPEDGTVIDIGAGYCDFINNVRAEHKFAVDISEGLREHVGDNVIAINSLAWDLSRFQDSSVDVVHASNLFEHFDDDELGKVMKEVKRVLRKGGKLILMQPNFRYSYKEYFDDYTHKKVFTHVSLEAFLLSHNMEILRGMKKFLPFSMKSGPTKLPMLSLIVRTYLRSPWKPMAGQMLFVARK